LLSVSVLTICTREKARSHPRQLLREDFALASRRQLRQRELDHLAMPAGRFYRGPPQRRLEPGLQALRAAEDARGAPLARVELHIVSAGYGLLGEHDRVVPYDCSFHGLGAAALRAWADHLALPRSGQQLLRSPCDLRLVLLIDPYLAALQLPTELELGGPTIFVVSRRAVGRLPRGAHAWVLRREDVGRFACPAVGLRGEIGARALALVAHEGSRGIERLLRAGEGFRELLA